MKYIVHRRFKKEVICGNVNIPAMTEVESVDGCIIYNGKIVCFDTSEDAHQFFARNDDGSGMLRGRLTQSIQKLLSERDPNYQQFVLFQSTDISPYSIEMALSVGQFLILRD